MCEIIQKLQDEAEAKARTEERMTAIRNIMESLNVPVQRAMEILKIPTNDWDKYSAQIQ